MYVCDWVLRDIGAEIGAHAPERGGALLGPRGRPVVARFVPDPEAETSSASYRPSRALDARVKELERAEDLELKGIVHSHPRALDRPSEQDARELTVGLRLNGHMPCYLAPIVTSPTTPELQPHELSLGEAKVSFFAGYRRRAGAALVRPLPVHVVPLLRDLEVAAAELGAAPPEVFLSDLGAGALPAGRLRPEGVELLIVASELYPALPPVLLVTAGGATEQLAVVWRVDTPAPERLLEAVRSAFEPPGPYRRAFGPRGGAALTRDPERARAAGWEVRFTGADVADEPLRGALFARSAGLLPAALRERAVLVAGCGSVGSYVAEQLVRSGVGAVALLDPEPVEPENLSRSVYDAEDVGRRKTEALARRLLRIAPALRCATHPRRVDALEPAALDGLVRAADLVVAATDDPGAQRSLNRFAYGRGKAALFVGLYAGAQGGEVLVTVPGRTPCYVCATRTRHEAERAAGRVAREVDYGTARLRGEIALGADIQHVASAAVKLGLSLLVPEGSAARLRSFADEAVAEGMTYLTLSTVPRYWFYPRVFEGAPGQGAYQSVWLTPSSSEACPVCGAPEHRLDPLDAPMRAPRRAAFRVGPRRQRPDT